MPSTMRQNQLHICLRFTATCRPSFHWAIRSSFFCHQRPFLWTLHPLAEGGQLVFWLVFAFSFVKARSRLSFPLAFALASLSFSSSTFTSKRNPFAFWLGQRFLLSFRRRCVSKNLLGLVRENLAGVRLDSSHCKFSRRCSFPWTLSSLLGSQKFEALKKSSGPLFATCSKNFFFCSCFLSPDALSNKTFAASPSILFLYKDTTVDWNCNSVMPSSCMTTLSVSSSSMSKIEQEVCAGASQFWKNSEQRCAKFVRFTCSFNLLRWRSTNWRSNYFWAKWCEKWHFSLAARIVSRGEICHDKSSWHAGESNK